jgi:hypothetical protein
VCSSECSLIAPSHTILSQTQATCSKLPVIWPNEGEKTHE